MSDFMTTKFAKDLDLTKNILFSMGAMEGLSYDDTVERLKKLYWPTLKACWMIWPVVMVSAIYGRKKASRAVKDVVRWLSSPWGAWVSSYSTLRTEPLLFS